MITAVILAAGESRRMGSENKLLLHFGRETRRGTAGTLPLAPAPLSSADSARGVVAIVDRTLDFITI